MKKYINYSLLILLIILTGCTNNEPTTQVEESTPTTPARLNVNGIEYISVGEMNEGEYTIDQELGKVEKKIAIDMTPYKSFVSNYLEEGIEIYSVVETKEIILAEISDGVYEIFSR